MPRQNTRALAESEDGSRPLHSRLKLEPSAFLPPSETQVDRDDTTLGAEWQGQIEEGGQNGDALDRPGRRQPERRHPASEGAFVYVPGERTLKRFGSPRQ